MGRTSLTDFDLLSRKSVSISTSKWPTLPSMAPSGMASMCSFRMTPVMPVQVTNIWPVLHARDMGSTS